MTKKGRWSCNRYGPDGTWRGWCGQVHPTEYQAKGHVEALNKWWPRLAWKPQRIVGKVRGG
jgi:hypothetical protein